MRRSRKSSVQFGQKSLSIALFFILLVVFLVGLSIALKIYLLFRAAKFDGEHEFILELHTPYQNQLLAFAPDTNSATILSLKGEALFPFGKYVEIPRDDTITIPDKYDTLYSLAQDLLFHPPEHLNLNIVDRVRLFLFVNNIKPTNITEADWSAGEGDDKKLTQLFTDHTAYNENLSIAVVNASGISGLGNKAAEYFSHIGLNVISVTSSQTQSDKTSIAYSGKEGYTTKRLSHILDVSAQISAQAMLSDITVALGKDAAEKF